VNYLAHLLLSGADPDVQVGGLLGDFVKGPLRETYPPAIEFGIQLHRRIDSLTDDQPAFRTAKSRLSPGWRRYAGIVLDIYFDHLLASRWEHLHDQALSDYCAAFYHHLAVRKPLLPAGALRFAEAAPRVAWLESYASTEAVPIMLTRVGQRLRRPVPMGEAWPELEANRKALERDFEELLPVLLEFARRERNRFFNQEL
jgi:acyl carrier protein phosphodiesterase